MERATMLEVAYALSHLLTDALNDPDGDTIELGRDEATIMLCIINGVAEFMEDEALRTRR